MSIAKSFDPALNWWELHPQLKLVEKFKELYESDKSKKKINSSLVMYFIANCYDKSSVFEKLPQEDKHKIVGSNICNSDKYYEKNQEDLDPLIDLYIYLDDNTPARRALREWELKMQERSLFIKRTPYSEDYYEEREVRGQIKEVRIAGTFKMLDDMMKATKPLWEDYKRIMEDMNKEDSNNSAKGDRELSLSDTGEI